MGPIRFNIDSASVEFLEGWACADDASVLISIEVDDGPAVTLSPQLERPDVAAALPGNPFALRSGFRFLLSRDVVDKAANRGTQLEIRVGIRRATDASPSQAVRIVLPRLALATASSSGHVLPEPIPGPFPAAVMRWVRAIEADLPPVDDGWTQARIERLIEPLIDLYRKSHIDDLHQYFGILARLWTAISFAARHFPRFNLARSPEAKDFRALQSSPIEMLAIAHHLGVLASHGMRGPLLEFGCFKGFSTSALSHGCREAGLSMEVFDSFQGLPESDSMSYQACDFAGSLEEVRRNVGSFGCIDLVRFHQGFFSDTVPASSLPEVSAIWLDVDLELSARDALRAFPALSPQGCVFSHECSPELFRDGEVVMPPRGPDSVVPPILDAFHASSRSPVGWFIHGNTAAFWDRSHGLPVLWGDALIRLKDCAIAGF
jgi:hypothetical protein